MSEEMTHCGVCDKLIPVKGKHRAIMGKQEVRVCFSCFLKLIRGTEGRDREAAKRDR